MISRENGTGRAADDDGPGCQVAVAAGQANEQARDPVGTDDRAASGPAVGATVSDAYDLGG